MNNLYLIIEFLLVSFVAGLVGTTGMTLFMSGVTKSGLTNADMVRAVGSLLTGSRESALLVGSILHCVSGVCFAMLYVILFNFFGLENVWSTVAIGIGLGFAHGYVLSFFLVVSVAEHHPMEEFRKAGIFVAVAHLLGHVVYGGLVGLVVGLYGFHVV